jgi:hypothetical protein
MGASLENPKFVPLLHDPYILLARILAQNKQGRLKAMTTIKRPSTLAYHEARLKLPSRHSDMRTSLLILNLKTLFGIPLVLICHLHHVGTLETLASHVTADNH